MWGGGGGGVVPFGGGGTVSNIFLFSSLFTGI